MGPPATAPGVLETGALRRVVAVLCLTQITSWGVLYYAFPVLAPSIAHDTGWPAAAVTAAFSAGQIAAGLGGIYVGHRIDRFGPRSIMTSGSLLAIPAIVAVAASPTYAVFLLGWIGAGAAMAGVLYPPAFAALTHWAGEHRVRALTALTLVGGLASTVFAPLTASISSAVSWRHTYLVLLAILTIVTVPAHWFGLAQPWVSRHSQSTDAERDAPDVRGVLGSRTFILLAIAMSMTAFSVFAVVINLVPLFIERGYTATQGAVALGMGGVGQVCGRLGYARFAARTSATARGTIIFAAVAASTALLAILPGPYAALVIISMAVGVSRGAYTLIQATAISDRWGTTNFGRLNGVLTAPIMTAMAVAPFAGTLIAGLTGSQSRSFLVLASIAALASVLFLATAPRTAAPRCER
ncbi:MFS transporter [Nocardioidaceae bacterium SCSIO 66511]|nr:MFS transporter [Nocardioidaceae bacterium SCSIO 66511]